MSIHDGVPGAYSVRSGMTFLPSAYARTLAGVACLLDQALHVSASLSAKFDGLRLCSGADVFGVGLALGARLLPQAGRLEHGVVHHPRRLGGGSGPSLLKD